MTDMNVLNNRDQQCVINSIVNNSSSSVFVKDLEGRYMMVNDEFARHFPKHSVSSILGMSAFDLFPMQVAEKLVSDENNIIRTGTPSIFEVAIPTARGEKTLLTNKFPLRDSQGKIYAVCGVTTDVTCLKQSETNLQAIFNAAHVSIIETDIHGVIRSFNRGAEALLGYAAQEIIGTATPLLIHKEEEVWSYGAELSRIMKRPINGFDVFAALPAQGKFEASEWTYVRKDGTTFPVQLVVNEIRNTQGEITGYLGIATDITHIKETQRALVERKKMTESIISTISDGIVLQDTTGTIIHCNHAAEKILGMRFDQLIGKPSVDSLGNPIYEDGRKFPANLHPAMIALTTGKSVRGQVMGIHKPTNETTWILINSEPIFYQGTDQVQYAVTSFTDITNIKEKEKKQKLSLDLMTEQNNRLQNFAHIVSHNLRSHAGNIYSLVNLYHATSSAAEKDDLMFHLRSAAASLNDTVKDLTNIVRVETSLVQERQPVSLKCCATKVLNILTADIKSKDAHIDLQIDDAITVIYNPSYLESILLNFITNAIKYKHPDRPPVIKLTAHYEQGHLILEIIDNGMGIDLAKYRDKLFGMYKTFHGNKDARGVGLFLVKNQIEAMGGRIEVESIVNTGTRFRVFLT